MQSSNCLNCDQQLTSNQHFCSNCGQKTSVHRLSFHDVGHDALHYFTHADKGILSLLKTLALQPGLVAREYVQGKRKKYFPPLNFFLIVGTLFVFMINLVNHPEKGNIITPQEQARYEKIKDPATKAYVKGILDRKEKSTRFFAKYSNFVSMIATPLISFILWLFYSRGKYNYTEHLVANMYISGFTVLCFALLFNPFMQLFGSSRTNPAILLYFIFEITYRAISYYYFIDKRTTKAAVKAGTAATTVIVFWFVLTYTTIYLYISSGVFGIFH